MAALAIILLIPVAMNFPLASAAPMQWGDNPLLPPQKGMATHDGIGSRPKTVLPPDDELVARQGEFLEAMRKDLQQGRLDRIAVIAPALSRLLPAHRESRAFECLALAAAGDLDAARRKRAELAAPAAEAATLLDCCDALIALKSGQPDAAGEAARRATGRDPSQPYPWNVLGRVQLAAGDARAAGTSFETALARNPNFIPARINRAALLLSQGDPAFAASEFRRALQISPNEPAARRGLARALSDAGDRKSALAEFQKIVQAEPGDLSSTAALATLLLEAGDHAEARRAGELLRDAGQANVGQFLAKVAIHAGDPAEARRELDLLPPDAPEVGILSVHCRIATRDLAGALEEVEKLIALDPAAFGPRVTRAALLPLLGKDGPAAADFAKEQNPARRALAGVLQGVAHGAKERWEECWKEFGAAPQVAEGFSTTGLDRSPAAGAVVAAELPPIGMGILLQVQGMNVLAEGFYRDALKVNPDSTLANYLAGALQLGTADRSQALPKLRASLVKSPDYFPSLYLLGELHLLAGDAKAAEEWFVKADRVAATPAIRFKLGVLCESTGRLDEAEAHYRSHLAAHPDFYVALNQLAWLLARRETKLDEALQLATRANKLQPGNASVLDTLGWIHFKLGRPLDAIPFLESSLKVHSGDPGTCYHLGAALVAAGRAGEAKTVLERSLQISGDGPDSAAVRQLLEKAKP